MPPFPTNSFYFIQEMKHSGFNVLQYIINFKLVLSGISSAIRNIKAIRIVFTYTIIALKLQWLLITGGPDGSYGDGVEIAVEGGYHY